MQQGVFAMSEQDYASPADVHAHGRSGAGVRRGLEQARDGVLPDGQLARLGAGYPANLALEPRHFGALFGLGLIYEELDQPEAALRSFEATLVLNPHSESTRQMIEQLRQQLRGSPT